MKKERKHEKREKARKNTEKGKSEKRGSIEKDTSCLGMMCQIKGYW